MKNSFVIFMAILICIGFLSGCGASNQTKGAVIGATTGAAAGAILADKDHKAVGIIIGAAVGGIAGGAIGTYMDEQAEKIREDLEGAKVERVGEGILITFDSGILFDINSYALKAPTRENLEKLAVTLNRYDETDVKVLGHTDNTGTEKHNEWLSEQRASSVHDYLIVEGVDNSRLSDTGYGELDPIATNATAEGRSLNRRVEIVIVADKKLQRAAKKGDLSMN